MYLLSFLAAPSQELRAAELPILPAATCKQKNVYGDAMTDGKCDRCTHSQTD